MYAANMQMDNGYFGMFKFSHTSGNFHYYSDSSGQWYAHNDAGQWYIQNAKGQFDPWSTDTLQQESVGSETVNVVPDNAAVVEMEICDDDAPVVQVDPNDLLLLPPPPPPPPPTEDSNITTQLTDATVANGQSNDWEQYYGQYSFATQASYGISMGSLPFTNAGWIYSGKRRTKVRPEDIDLPAGPPPSVVPLETTPTSVAYYSQTVTSSVGQNVDTKKNAAKQLISRQLKQFAMLQKAKEAAAEEASKTVQPASVLQPTTTGDDDGKSAVDEGKDSEPRTAEMDADDRSDHDNASTTTQSETSSSVDQSDKAKSTSRAIRPSSIAQLSSNESDPVVNYQPVFCLYTETELAWPIEEIQYTKAKPSLSYSYYLPNTFRHLLSLHDQARKQAQRRAQMEHYRKWQQSRSSVRNHRYRSRSRHSRRRSRSRSLRRRRSNSRRRRSKTHRSRKHRSRSRSSENRRSRMRRKRTRYSRKHRSRSYDSPPSRHRSRSYSSIEHHGSSRRRRRHHQQKRRSSSGSSNSSSDDRNSSDRRESNSSA